MFAFVPTWACVVSKNEKCFDVALWFVFSAFVGVKINNKLLFDKNNFDPYLLCSPQSIDIKSNWYQKKYRVLTFIYSYDFIPSL